MNAKAELERMVALLNEKAFGRPDESRRLKLKLHDRLDLDGVLAFIVLAYNCETAVRNTAMMPVTLCWGGGHTADQACETAIRKFAAGSDLFREYFPFIPCTAGSAAELEVKLAAFGGEGRPA